ncbi:hypothetical protein GGI35DRAFT_340958 [Trichoderma velutinum]
MAMQQTVKVETTATDTKFYLKYIGEDPDFHKACTTLHYDIIDKNHSDFYRRESDDTMSFPLPGPRPDIKHSEGLCLVSLLPTYTHILSYLFKFPNTLLDID